MWKGEHTIECEWA